MEHRDGYQKSDNSLHAVAIQALIMEGDYQRFKVLLRRRLQESGWCDQIRIMARDVIKEKGQDITFDQLWDEVSPKGRAAVPTPVKKELLQKVKEDLLQLAGYYNVQNSQDNQIS